MTDGILHEGVAESEGLDTAVVLTAGGRDAAGPGPLTLVGGLTLFQRTLLTLQRGGIGQALVLAGPEEAALKRLVRGDPRMTIAVRWLPVREFPPEDPQTWEAALGDVRGYCLLVGAQTLFSRELVERLRREVRESPAALLVCRPEERGPARPAAGNRDEARADLMVVRGSLLGAARTGGRDAAATASWSGGRGVGAEALPPARSGWLAAMIDRAAAEGGLRTLSLPPDSPCWLQPVRGPAEAGRAERRLLTALASPFEGFVDRYFNRRFSAPLTRLFLRIGLPANAVTVLATLIGLLAATVIARGSYMAGIVGALLFQLAAVVDCCDGEIARLTFTESKLGERLDLWGDNLVHVAVFAGVAWAVARSPSSLLPAGLSLACGAAAVAGTLLSLWLVIRAHALRERGRFATAATAARVDGFLRTTASRDFSVTVLGFALVGRLDLFILFAAIGANLFWITLGWVTRPSKVLRG
jgi:phosphatidylglycerophosphate synthase